MKKKDSECMLFVLLQHNFSLYYFTHLSPISTFPSKSTILFFPTRHHTFWQDTIQIDLKIIFLCSPHLSRPQKMSCQVLFGFMHVFFQYLLRNSSYAKAHSI